MKCGNCPYLRWYCVHAFYYCKFTLKIVKEGDECTCPEELKKRELDKTNEQRGNTTTKE